MGDELVGKAVGVQQSLAGLAGLGGAALGGVLYDVVGYHLTMLLDTITFALLALTAMAVHTRRGRRFDAGATNVVEVFLITDDLGASAAVYGAAMAAFMLGQIVGPLLSGRVREDVQRSCCAVCSRSSSQSWCCGVDEGWRDRPSPLGATRLQPVAAGMSGGSTGMSGGSGGLSGGSAYMRPTRVG